MAKPVTSIAVKVIDHEGKPVGGAKVYLRILGKGGSDLNLITATNDPLLGHAHPSKNFNVAWAEKKVFVRIDNVDYGIHPIPAQSETGNYILKIKLANPNPEQEVVPSKPVLAPALHAEEETVAQAPAAAKSAKPLHAKKAVKAETDETEIEDEDAQEEELGGEEEGIEDLPETLSTNITFTVTSVDGSAVKNPTAKVNGVQVKGSGNSVTVEVEFEAKDKPQFVSIDCGLKFKSKTIKVTHTDAPQSIDVKLSVYPQTVFAVMIAVPVILVALGVLLWFKPDAARYITGVDLLGTASTAMWIFIAVAYMTNVFRSVFTGEWFLDLFMPAIWILTLFHARSMMEGGAAYIYLHSAVIFTSQDAEFQAFLGKALWHYIPLAAASVLLVVACIWQKNELKIALLPLHVALGISIVIYLVKHSFPPEVLTWLALAEGLCIVAEITLYTRRVVIAFGLAIVMILATTLAGAFGINLNGVRLIAMLIWVLTFMAVMIPGMKAERQEEKKDATRALIGAKENVAFSIPLLLFYVFFFLTIGIKLYQGAAVAAAGF